MTIDEPTLFAALSQHAVRVAHGTVEPGTDIEIAGETTPAGKLLAVYGGERPRRALPIGEADARVLADGVLAYHHHVAPHVRRMLEHLFIRVATIFSATELTGLRLMVRIHGDGYTVVHAGAQATRELQFVHRRQRRGNANGYRPSGRQ